LTSTNTDPANRKVVLFFRGTSRELRAWLAEISLLTSDDAYEWDLTASISRHPAGKGLGTPADAPALTEPADPRDPQQCPDCGEVCRYDGWDHVHANGLGMRSCHLRQQRDLHRPTEGSTADG
jgi:hypothetical protein